MFAIVESDLMVAEFGVIIVLGFFFRRLIVGVRELPPRPDP